MDFQQRKKLMFLAGYWVYNLKQVDLSLLKHIRPWCVGFFSSFFTMPRVSIADRNRTLGYLETGWIDPRVNRHVGVHQSTIHRLVQRHQQTNAVAGRRPRVTSDRQDRHVVTSTTSLFTSINHSSADQWNTRQTNQQ